MNKYFDGKMKEAAELYEKGSYTQAVNIWKVLFDKGYSIPGYYLGVAYQQGKGVERNLSKANRYFQVAAECGFKPALTYLGKSYEEKIKPLSDDEVVFKESLQAADRGSAKDMYVVAILYHQGKGVAKDDTKALKYLEKSARAGIVRANVDLGHYYLDRDEAAKSYPYFKRAAESGSAHALYVTAQLTRDGEGVEASPEAALPMFQKAAEMGNHDALSDMGLIYEEGELIKRNYKKAAEYYQKAVDAGCVLAHVNLGLAYANGRGVRKSLKKAADLFAVAADEGEPAGLYYYGMMFFNGEGGRKQDYVIAYHYIAPAAEKGEGYAYNALSVMFEKGLGVKKNLTQAKKYYRLAKQAGCVEELEVKN